MIVDYLLRPPITLRSPRPHAAIGILVAYSILLLLMSSTYFRLFHLVVTSPGYVPRGPQWHDEQKKQKKHTRKRRLSPGKNGPESATFEEKVNGSTRQATAENGLLHLDSIPYNDRAPGARPLAGGHPSPDLRDFYTKDVFVCEGDGRPIWCSTCINWKPDRAHHCREVGRCVKKMDHFCPW